MIPIDPTHVRIEFDQRVPMRDGITLSANVFLPAPAADQRYPTILMRTPYLKGSEPSFDTARYFAERGYVFVAMDVRGRGDSDGDFTPYVHDGRDGYDAIEWCAGQPWSDGRVGLHLVSGRVTQPMEAVDWERVYPHLPLLTMDERAGRRNAHWRTQIEHAQLDAHWEPLRYQSKFDQLDVPVLHISGWYDDEQIGTPLNYIGMTAHAATAEARASQRLLMGPWGHSINRAAKLGEVDFGPEAVIDLRGEELRWFDRWLKRQAAEGPADGGAPVRVFVMGANKWRDEREWPLARTQWTAYYLRSNGRANSRFGDGSLATEAPPADEPPDRYRYDPARPVPFITEPTSSQIGGPDDYAAAGHRFHGQAARRVADRLRAAALRRDGSRALPRGHGSSSLNRAWPRLPVLD